MNKQTQRVIAAVILTAAVSAAVTYAVSRYFFERPVLGPGVVVSRLRSEALGEEREFLVHLPASYARDTDRRYGVLYVLDGTSQDLHTAESAALMARIGVIPEVLVVGIPNVSGRGRQRDYAPPGMRQDMPCRSWRRGRPDPSGGARTARQERITRAIPSTRRRSACISSSAASGRPPRRASPSSAGPRAS